MTLAEALTSPAPHTSGLPCSVAQILAGLDDDDRTVLQRALSDRQISAGQIYNALVAEGHSVGRQTIPRHRRGHCRCEA